MMRRGWLVLLVVFAPWVQAASVHAFLNRQHVSLGDTVTLNIQSSSSIGNPDLAPLQKDFQVLGVSRSRSTQIDNGKATTTAQLGIALKPRHAGSLTIPALTIAGATTIPLTLSVTAAPSGGQGKVGDPVFMQASVLSNAPYVGQQTVYTLRLFYQPGVNGSLGDPQVSGARLIKLDRDHRYMVRRNGYAYQVLERSWALIPGRSGAITVQGPKFNGRSLRAGNLNSLLNNPNSPINNPNALLQGPFPGFGTQVKAVAPAVSLNVRAAPAKAGKPWLPARAMQLKLSGLPAGGKLKAGVPVTVTLSISATGLPADALPEPALPDIPGARIYPDQTQDSTDASGQWLIGKRARSFAIVPDHDGSLTIPAITLNWWDVVHARAEQASLSAHTLQVSGAPGAGGANLPATPVASNASLSNPSAAAARSSSGEAQPAGKVVRPGAFWRWLALASFALWGVAAIAVVAWWFLHRRKLRIRGVTTDSRRCDTQSEPMRVRTLRKQALDAVRAGDAAACEHALLAWARALRPDILHVGMLHDALENAQQREALDALQRARWKGGDASQACAAVAGAFAHGFEWRGQDKPARAANPDLPPLYPSPQE